MKQLIITKQILSNLRLLKFPYKTQKWVNYTALPEFDVKFLSKLENASSSVNPPIEVIFKLLNFYGLSLEEYSDIIERLMSWEEADVMSMTPLGLSELITNLRATKTPNVDINDIDSLVARVRELVGLKIMENKQTTNIVPIPLENSTAIIGELIKFFRCYFAKKKTFTWVSGDKVSRKRISAMERGASPVSIDSLFYLLDKFEVDFAMFVKAYLWKCNNATSENDVELLHYLHLSIDDEIDGQMKIHFSTL